MIPPKSRCAQAPIGGITDVAAFILDYANKKLLDIKKTLNLINLSNFKIHLSYHLLQALADKTTTMPDGIRQRKVRSNPSGNIQEYQSLVQGRRRSDNHHGRSSGRR
jgi:hypothetical protein